MELSGKKVLVCGSTQGIGWATAKLLVSRGAEVTLMARNEEKLRRCLGELNEINTGNHNVVVADFSNLESFEQIVQQFIAKQSFDALVNNTGGPAGGPIIDANIAAFQAAFQQHLLCNHLLVQAVVPQMISSGGGSIVNVISTSVKQPLPNLGVSNTIRGAVANWSKTMASELGPKNIRVNNVLPGATNTSRLQEIADAKSKKTGNPSDEILTGMGQESPMKRIAEPNEVAEAIAFLISDRASYINGINIPVDGGRTKSL